MKPAIIVTDRNEYFERWACESRCHSDGFSEVLVIVPEFTRNPEYAHQYSSIYAARRAAVKVGNHFGSTQVAAIEPEGC